MTYAGFTFGVFLNRQWYRQTLFSLLKMEYWHTCNLEELEESLKELRAAEATQQLPPQLLPTLPLQSPTLRLEPMTFTAKSVCWVLKVIDRRLVFIASNALSITEGTFGWYLSNHTATGHPNGFIFISVFMGMMGIIYRNIHKYPTSNKVRAWITNKYVQRS